MMRAIWSFKRFKLEMQEFVRQCGSLLVQIEKLNQNVMWFNAGTARHYEICIFRDHPDGIQCQRSRPTQSG
jgi:hypothetical protein